MISTGIGIVFNIDSLGGGFYGAKAWRIVMKHLRPSHLLGFTLKEGDTNDSLNGGAREYCIAFFGSKGGVDYIRTTFAELDDRGLVSKDRRFIESPKLDSEPLITTGSIDAHGHFVENAWTRVFHDLCRETGWGYKPGNIPKDLSPELRNELKQLMRSPGADAQPEHKKWWQFFR